MLELVYKGGDVIEARAARCKRQMAYDMSKGWRQVRGKDPLTKGEQREADGMIEYLSECFSGEFA